MDENGLLAEVVKMLAGADISRLKGPDCKPDDGERSLGPLPKHILPILAVWQELLDKRDGDLHNRMVEALCGSCAKNGADHGFCAKAQELFGAEASALALRIDFVADLFWAEVKDFFSGKLEDGETITRVIGKDYQVMASRRRPKTRVLVAIPAFGLGGGCPFDLSEFGDFAEDMGDGLGGPPL